MRKSDLNVDEPSDSKAVVNSEPAPEMSDPTNPDDEEDTSMSAYLWLLVFSVLMFTFPFLTFYAVRSWLVESFDFSEFQTNCFAVLAAVLVVNAIISMYVLKAFREEGSSKKAAPTVRETKKLK